jgi:hypothetical protein
MGKRPRRKEHPHYQRRCQKNSLTSGTRATNFSQTHTISPHQSTDFHQKN